MSTFFVYRLFGSEKQNIMVKSQSKLERTLKRIALAGISTLLGASLVWFTSPNYLKDRFANPFSHNPFMSGYQERRIFERDKNLGFRFLGGKLITRNDFSTLEKILVNGTDNNCVVLNMGDSSTSGWNSDYAYEGQENPRAVFFTYKNYSDLLEEQSSCLVINAGVPGYSSFQGKKYLEQLSIR